MIKTDKEEEEEDVKLFHISLIIFNIEINKMKKKKVYVINFYYDIINIIIKNKIE